RRSLGSAARYHGDVRRHCRATRRDYHGHRSDTPALAPYARDPDIGAVVHSALGRLDPVNAGKPGAPPRVPDPSAKYRLLVGGVPRRGIIAEIGARETEAVP